MIKYLIDVDGVVRNLYSRIKIFPTMGNVEDKWLPELPKDLWEDMTNNAEYYFYESDIYEDMKCFLKNFLGLNECAFLTNQCGIRIREEMTTKWIRRYFGYDNMIIFTSNFQEKINILKDNQKLILFDDYPFFYKKEGFKEVKDRIYLVTRSWNKEERKHYENLLRMDD